jgi:hypothetical protein
VPLDHPIGDCRSQHKTVGGPSLRDIERRLAMKMKLLGMHFKGYKLSLTNLHMHLFNMDFGEAHRAKADVQALVRCCRQLYAQGDL